MALSIGGIVALGPKIYSAEDIAAFYNQLHETWEIPKCVCAYLKEELEIHCPEDILACFASDRDWEKFHEVEIKDSEKADANVKRGPRGKVYRAFLALQAAQSTGQKQRERGEDSADLDSMLDPKDIKEMTRRFWLRHKLVFSSDEMPGDILLSRVVREMERRFLHNADVLKVKGVATERRGKNKKKAIGDTGLTYQESAAEAEFARPATVGAYLAGLRMYMLALAIWGSKAIEPAPRDEETRETKPETYVQFPWQFSQDYCHRAQRFANDALEELAAKEVYGMVRKRDEEEREMWVDAIRNTESSTLGQIFREIYERRAVRWIFDSSRRVGDQPMLALEDIPATPPRPSRHLELQTADARAMQNTIRSLKESNTALKANRDARGGGGGRRWQAVAQDTIGGGSKGTAGKGGQGGKGGGKKRPGGLPVTLAKDQSGIAICAAWNRGQCGTVCLNTSAEEHVCNGKIGKDTVRRGKHRSMDCQRCERV